MDRRPWEDSPAAAPQPARWRSAVVAAIVAAVVSAAVAVPVARLTAPSAEPPAADQQAAEEAGGEDPPEGTASTVATGAVADDPTSPDAAAAVTEVADAVSPSVAYVEVAGPGGQGSGSAVIIDDGGYLLTNAHVVEGARDLTVTLADGARHEATLVGADPTSDLAVLEVDASGLPALAIDDDVEVGEPVVAIGSPFGLEGSVTSGIVSGEDRTLAGGRGQPPLLGMIQTDAAINPGNSGGALVDMDGELVGINTAIYSATGTSSGVGFAIPAGTAEEVAGQLIENGSVTYAQLGVRGGDVTDELASAYGLDADSGALVAEVMAGSGAAEAGLRPGDAIVALDGEPVGTMSALTALVRAREPGEEVTVTVDRDGEELELDVTLGSAS